jgi:hypothetical protein
MADHLTIDMALVANTATGLGRLHDEFAHSGSIADADAWAIGSGELAGALHSFATDWRHHRDRLVEAMKGLQAAAHDCVSGFTHVDQGLGKSLDGTK